ncbi:hypothetical protein ACIPJK_34625 [Streptomyces roseus]|uniref:hypothetical protein n=1 Tax=Streptomyces roseus TaxID=66430 RepID=UPI0037F198A6
MRGRRVRRAGTPAALALLLAALCAGTGSASASVRADFGHAQRRASPSKGTVADATNRNPSWSWAAGAVISDLDDLHTWAPALADGRLLTPRTQAERCRAAWPFRSG